MDSYHDKQALLQAISQIKFTGGGTATHLGLQYVRETSFSPAYGARNDVAKIAIILTDGTSNSFNNTIQQAALLKQAGVTVFAIGVGNVYQQELEAIASQPISSHMFVIGNYTALTHIKGSLNDAACEGNNFFLPNHNQFVTYFKPWLLFDFFYSLS